MFKSYNVQRFFLWSNVKYILYHFIIMTGQNSISKCHTLTLMLHFLYFTFKKKKKKRERERQRELVISSFAPTYFSFCCKSALFKSQIPDWVDKTINHTQQLHGCIWACTPPISLKTTKALGTQPLSANLGFKRQYPSWNFSVWCRNQSRKASEICFHT